jgi:hypothetical protein
MFVRNLYWGEALLLAAYWINQVSSRVLGNVSPIKFMLTFSFRTHHVES